MEVSEPIEVLVARDLQRRRQTVYRGTLSKQAMEFDQTTMTWQPHPCAGKVCVHATHYS